jgi:hypothetical protein
METKEQRVLTRTQCTRRAASSVKFGRPLSGTSFLLKLSYHKVVYDADALEPDESRPRYGERK